MSDRAPAASYKSQLLPNLVSNFLLIFVQGVSSLILTPFLIGKLDVELFGIVMLFVSISNYVYIFTISINNSAGRELILNFKGRDGAQASRTFNSFLLGNVGLLLLLLPAVLVASRYLTRIFNVPPGSERSVRQLFVILSLSFLLHFVQSAFAVSSWAMNRFDIRNYHQVAYFVARLLLVIVAFTAFAPRLPWFALSYLLATLLLLLLDFLAFRRLTPGIRLGFSFFDPAVLKRLWILSFWFSVSQVGAILFFKFSLFLINILLGARAGGEYAAVLQLSLLIQQVGFSIGTILHPAFISLYAEGRWEAMLARADQALKLMAVLMVPPVALMAGAARPLLAAWLGERFAGLGFLLVLLLFSVLIEMVVRPLYSIHFACDRIRVPSLMTLAFGALNVLLVILFVRWHGGIVGVAWAGFIAMNLRSLIFVPLYTAHIQKIGLSHYLKRLLAVLVAAVVFSGACAFAVRRLDIRGWRDLLLYLVLSGGAYLVAAYFLALNRADRRFVYDLLPGEWLRRRMRFLAK